MNSRTAARHYAHALFSVVEPSGRLAEVDRGLGTFAALVTDHAELRAALLSPAVTPAQKRAIVDALLSRSGIDGEARRLIELLADSDRLSLLREIAEAFHARVQEASGLVTAELVTAAPVGDERQAALARALGRATGRSVELSGRIDPDIIGGAVARVGDVVYDGSVARQLERMRQRLSSSV